MAAVATRWLLAATLLVSKVTFGGVAQLVERLHGMQEVAGSIPVASTGWTRAFRAVPDG